MPGEKTEREAMYQFTWRGQRYDVHDGADMLRQLCRMLYRLKPEQFRKLPDAFPVRRKRWFARSGIGMHRSHSIEDSGVWLDITMSTVRKKLFAKDLLRHFGFNAEEIEFKTRKSYKLF